VNLAKRFSTERSGSFVNGVLAKLLPFDSIEESR
jgi:transcription termination factor NusB